MVRTVLLILSRTAATSSRVRTTGNRSGLFVRTNSGQLFVTPGHVSVVAERAAEVSPEYGAMSFAFSKRTFLKSTIGLPLGRPSDGARSRRRESNRPEEKLVLRERALSDDRPPAFEHERGLGATAYGARIEAHESRRSSANTAAPGASGTATVLSDERRRDRPPFAPLAA